MARLLWCSRSGYNLPAHPMTETCTTMAIVKAAREGFQHCFPRPWSSSHPRKPSHGAGTSCLPWEADATLQYQGRCSQPTCCRRALGAAQAWYVVVGSVSLKPFTVPEKGRGSEPVNRAEEQHSFCFLTQVKHSICLLQIIT